MVNPLSRSLPWHIYVWLDQSAALFWSGACQVNKKLLTSSPFHRQRVPRIHLPSIETRVDLLKATFTPFIRRMDALKQQALINQFVNVAGCASDQAKKLLQAGHWQFEVSEIFVYIHTIAHAMLCFVSVCVTTPALFIRFSIHLFFTDRTQFVLPRSSNPVSFSTFGKCLDDRWKRTKCQFEFTHTHVVMLMLIFLSFSQLVTPANTPATPPNFPEALFALQRLSASDSNTKSNQQEVRWFGFRVDYAVYHRCRISILSAGGRD